MICYIGVGSNQKNPLKQAQLALIAIDKLPKTQITNTSSFYSSSPMGPQDQPDYINAVVEVKTQLTPLELLDELQHIEQSQGRVRKDDRWGPRTLDLDILLYGNLAIENSRLTIPHYGMKVREFVLYPMFEIAPYLNLPDDIKLSDLVKNCDINGLSVVAVS